MLTAKLLLVYVLETVALTANIDTTKINPEEAFCLAENIYHEARGEGLQGQLAVASVTINRVKHSQYPDSICEVVRQTTITRTSKKIICAFSWYCANNGEAKEIPLRNKDGTINEKVAEQFKQISEISIKILAGKMKDNTNGATHFHNPEQSQPAWANEMTLTKKLGNHHFYKP